MSWIKSLSKRAPDGISQAMTKVVCALLEVSVIIIHSLTHAYVYTNQTSMQNSMIQLGEPTTKYY